MKVEIQNLTKRFGQKTAVDDVSLTLTSGVWGLIGANGAGKTTLMRMLAGILTPTSGRVLCDGADTLSLGEAWRDMLGYLPQHFGFYPEFTVADYLDYMAALKGIEKSAARRKIEELCEILSLTRVYKNKIKKLSGGTQRRVGIAQAMLNDPEVLILDEPTSGLDPGERVRFRNLLSEFARDRIVLISTHIVSDVEYIAAENAVMKDGKLIDVGTTEQLLRAVEGKVFTALVPDGLLAQAEREVRVVSLKNEGGGQTLLRYVADAPLLHGSEMAEPRLEDLYLWLFKDERRQEDV